MKESKVDVLVIGAGPAGLMAAYALAKAGVNVRVIDKRCVVVRSYYDCTEFRFINEDPAILWLVKQMDSNRGLLRCYR
jgi:2-polyprenyl-6-methoxyphenol hydroxylase-like FAD-dependent oxidoreductase